MDKGAHLKILTFNFHETFLCCLAKLGFDFDVVTDLGGKDLKWSPAARPVPSNLHLISSDDARERLKAGVYDVVISHTVFNLLSVFSVWKTPHIFVAHIPLMTTSWSAV